MHAMVEDQDTPWDVRMHAIRCCGVIRIAFTFRVELGHAMVEDQDSVQMRVEMHAMVWGVSAPYLHTFKSRMHAIVEDQDPQNRSLFVKCMQWLRISFTQMRVECMQWLMIRIHKWYCRMHATVLRIRIHKWFSRMHLNGWGSGYTNEL